MFEYSNVYFVPSHRTIEDENIVDYLSEVTFAFRERRKSVPFILLDDTDTNINASKLAYYRRDFNEIDRFVLNKPAVIRIYDEIGTELAPGYRRIFKSLYPSSAVNYGNTLNKMFIMAVVFGAASFHRRDSDVLADISHASSRKIYPIEVELNYLGAKLDGRTVYIAGSGYKGMRNIDFGEILGNDVSLYEEYLRCFNLPEDYLSKELSKFQRERDEPFTVDRYRVNGDPECGNISFFDVFRFLPSSPAPYTLGTDYFTKQIVNQSNLGLVYHNRKVIHRHTPCRYDTREKIHTYVRGVAAYVDSMSFYADFFVNLEAEMIKQRSFEGRLSELAVDLADYYKAVIRRFDARTDQRRECFRRFIELLKKSGNSEIRNAAPILLDEEDEVFTHTNNLLANHVELIEAWPFIVDAAESARKKPVVQDILQASEIA